jgi:hypothetical protein
VYKRYFKRFSKICIMNKTKLNQTHNIKWREKLFLMRKPLVNYLRNVIRENFLPVHFESFLQFLCLFLPSSLCFTFTHSLTQTDEMNIFTHAGNKGKSLRKTFNAFTWYSTRRTSSFFSCFSHFSALFLYFLLNSQWLKGNFSLPYERINKPWETDMKTNKVAAKIIIRRSRIRSRSRKRKKNKVEILWVCR